MSKKRKLIACIFCGDESVESSEEDVIPQWLADKMAHYCRVALGDENAKPLYVNFTYESSDQLLADSHAGTMGANASGRKVIGERPVAYKLPDVCVKCNGGWMERLEFGVRRLIPGLLEGKTKPLDPYDQLVLSMWAIKTSLTYDASQDQRLVPGEHGSRLLYANGYPLPYTQVLIGHTHDVKMDGEILHGIDTRHLNTNPQCPALSISFRFGHFVTFTIINMPTPEAIANGRPPLLSLGPTDDPKFVQIWPPSRERIKWPSHAAKAARGLATLA